MIKKLLIGASALAITTTVAHAAEVNEIDISAVTTRPVAEAAYNTAFGVADTATDALDQTLNNATRQDGSTTGVANAVTKATTIVNSVANSSGLSASNSGNQGNIDQDGNDNLGEIDQLGGTNGLAVIKQSNQATIGDPKLTAKITQSDEKTGTAGARNLAYIQQVTVNGPVSGGIRPNSDERATITQNHVAATGYGANNAAILQGGFLNSATARLDRATVTQNGAGNDALVAQSAAAGGDLGDSSARIAQIGNGNRAAMQQQIRGRTGGGTASSIEQNGNDHQAYSVQQGTASSGFVYSKIVQGVAGGVQSGNFAAINQTLTPGAFTSSTIEQFGNSNVAWNSQAVAGSTSEISQDGDNNYAEVRQFARASSIVDQDNGNNNEAFVTQTSVATGAKSTLFQTGSDNLGTVFQSVASDIANVSQTGGSNVAIVRQ